MPHFTRPVPVGPRGGQGCIMNSLINYQEATSNLITIATRRAFLCPRGPRTPLYIHPTPVLYVQHFHRWSLTKLYYAPLIFIAIIHLIPRPCYEPRKFTQIHCVGLAVAFLLVLREAFAWRKILFWIGIFLLLEVFSFLGLKFRLCWKSVFRIQWWMKICGANFETIFFLILSNMNTLLFTGLRYWIKCIFAILWHGLMEYDSF